MGYSVGIVGGGAAGMMAAIAAAGQGAGVTVMEGNDRPGRKLLSTGNGKCNLGNERLRTEYYFTDAPEFLEECLKRFGTGETVAFFREIGLLVKSRNGYLYPMSEQASSVLDVLRYRLRQLGVGVITDCKVESIELSAEPGSGKRSGRQAGRGAFQERGKAGTNICGEAFPGKGSGADRRSEREDGSSPAGISVRGGGRTYRFDRVILACGGRAAPKTGSDGSGYRLAESLGHTLVPVVPALVQLRCAGIFFPSVAGVRADALLTVRSGGKCAAQERGELQLTEYGISGIPVFQISRVVNYILRGGGKAEVCIDFLPDIPGKDYERLQAERASLQRGRTVEEFFTGLLNKKLLLLFIRQAGLKASEDAGRADPEKLRRVYRLCREWTVAVTGSNPYDNAQVCAGGVPLAEVTRNMESRKVPGIYFAGEILDVDGKCGGYNLQWAWCSGYIAGMAASGGAVPVE